ncbi:PREDICTED: putative aquaporin NIP4-1 [Camelina sativa]|uniref:Aquaporin NIP4-1 n=1 Tax=Camelina sativa TaxID=90675 RepID=A0ABM0UGP8_CAMSA|nr:PREDICTED: putative aquaporin NIP4-1 [Camelina sativa]
MYFSQHCLPYPKVDSGDDCGVVVVNVLYGGTVTFPGICVTWGLIVMVMIYSTGHISGAHFNPAVTVTFAIFRRFPWYQVPLYIGAQFAGSLLASLTLRLMFKVTPEAFFGTTPADSPARALVAEIIILFLLMFVISGVATDNRAVGELAGIAVGMTIMLNVFVAGPVSGASMNPARSLGPALVMGVYKHIWVYIVGPVLGVMSGGFVYNLIRFTDKPLRELTKSGSFLRSISPSHKASSSKS